MSLTRAVEMIQSTSPGSLPLSHRELHTAIEHHRRRTAIRVLADRAPLTRQELVEAVAEIEEERWGYNRHLQNSVTVTLHQHHLPALDRAGVTQIRDGQLSLKVPKAPILAIIELTEALCTPS